MRSDEELLAMTYHGLLLPEERKRADQLSIARHAEVRERIAFIEGKQEAMRETAIDQLIHDDVLRDLIRVQQWAKQPDHGIGFDRVTDQFTGVPEGWPGDIEDGQLFFELYVIETINSLRVSTVDTPPEETESVKRMRAVLGGN